MGMSPGHPRPRVPWLLVPLLVVAGTAATKPQQVSGVLGGSVLLSPLLPPNKTVKEIEWSFSAGAGATIQVAEFSPGGFERPDPKDRFKERLEMFNGTALKIRALEWGDSGVYGARIKLHPALVEEHCFNLSVYGPVPEPEIQPQWFSLTTQGCNVTLRCQLPAGSNAEATWQVGTPWGQLCEDSQTLCLAVPTSAFNSTYTCVARNPIQEQNVSIRLDTLCRQQETHGWCRRPLCPVLLVVTVGAVGALLGVWLWRKKKKRRKKRARGAALASPASEDAPLEPQYAEIQRRSPPETDERRDHPTTIYSWVQAGAGSGDEVLA